MPRTINLAHTASVNPPSAGAAISPLQAWRALDLKVRAPTTFLRQISACRVLADRGADPAAPDTLTREVTFAAGGGPVVERCTYKEPHRIDFALGEGKGRVVNMLSDGDDGELLLTFAFEWPLAPEDESREAEVREKYRVEAKGAVASTVRAMHELAEKGEV